MFYVRLVTFLIFVVAGAVPALFSHYVIKAKLLGGPWIGSLIGIIGAVIGSLADALFLSELPELLPIGGAADIVPPAVGSIALVALYAVISASNDQQQDSEH